MGDSMQGVFRFPSGGFKQGVSARSASWSPGYSILGGRTAGLGAGEEEAGGRPGPWAAAMSHPHGGKYKGEPG